MIIKYKLRSAFGKEKNKVFTKDVEDAVQGYEAGIESKILNIACNLEKVIDVLYRKEVLSDQDICNMFLSDEYDVEVISIT